MREAMERTIYNNYNLWEEYAEEAKNNILENTGNEDPSDNEIWDEIHFLDSLEWDEVKESLDQFFSEGTWILSGTIGRWNGNYEAGTVFTDFNRMFAGAARDCDYVNFYDKNGHLYLECSHHDGTNLYEIKKITDKGISYLENWEQNFSDRRSEKYVHSKIMEKYSTLPHFLHKVYGCPKTEWKSAA